jgi:hypothetical protein
MAQTKRKRQTKHRGNAAGVVEARGRTSRPPSPEERKNKEREKAKETRLTRKPTWRQSASRALLAGAFIFILLYITDSKSSDRLLSSVLFAIVATLIYIPGGYYLETAMWRRRMAKRGGPDSVKR